MKLAGIVLLYAAAQVRTGAADDSPLPRFAQQGLITLCKSYVIAHLDEERTMNICGRTADAKCFCRELSDAHYTLKSGSRRLLSVNLKCYSPDSSDSGTEKTRETMSCNGMDHCHCCDSLEGAANTCLMHKGDTLHCECYDSVNETYPTPACCSVTTHGECFEMPGLTLL